MEELVLNGHGLSKKLKLFMGAAALAGLAWFYWPMDNKDKFSRFRHPSTVAKTFVKEAAAPKKLHEKNNKQVKKKARKPAQRREAPSRPKPFRREMPPKDTQTRLKALELLKRKGQKPLEKNRDLGDFTNEQGEGFELVEDLSAVEKNQENERLYPNAQVVAGHLLIDGPAATGVSMPVVKNVKDGNYAVFTGILRIKFRDFTYERELAAAHDAIIDKSYGYIQTSLFRFDTYDETLAAMGSLKAHPAVLTVTVELLEYRRQPN